MEGVLNKPGHLNLSLVGDCNYGYGVDAGLDDGMLILY